jgi:hypothetical protein
MDGIVGAAGVAVMGAAATASPAGDDAGVITFALEASDFEPWPDSANAPTPTRSAAPPIDATTIFRRFAGFVTPSSESPFCGRSRRGSPLEDAGAGAVERRLGVLPRFFAISTSFAEPIFIHLPTLLAAAVPTSPS